MSSLADRAAKYVGMEDKPRTSVSMRPDVCLVVWQDGYGLLYSEEGRQYGQGPRGEWFKLTYARHERLLEALDRVELGAQKGDR